MTFCMISSNSSQIIIDYFKVQYNLEQLILTLIQNECNIEENIDNLDNFILDQQINENKKELHLMLKLILSLCNNYKRSENFFKKIEKIILKYKSEILDFFQSIELFNLFKTNKRIILFLFENGFLDLDRLVSQIINHEQDPFQNYLSYFSLEFKNSALNEEAGQNQEIYNIDLFNQKRMLGENDNEICKLIQKDLIDDFKSYIQRSNYCLESKIPFSIFETNLFLLKNEASFIEYSAFFGSFNIFQYLYNQNVNTTPSIWIYAIHGSNIEIIQFLENHNIKPVSYEKCFIESIKCHWHELTIYLLQKYKINKDSSYIFNKCLKYYNFFVMEQFSDFLIDFYYSCVNNLSKKSSVFETLFEFCRFDYIKIVEIALTAIENSMTIQISNLKQVNQAGSFSFMMNDISDCYLKVLNICLFQNQIIESQNNIIKNLETENRVLQNKNKILLMNKSVIEKKYKKEIQKNKLLLGKLKKTNLHVYELSKKVDELSKIENKYDVNGPMNLTSTIISELIKNENISVYSRKYSKSLKDICFLLFINSNITYKLLRKFLPLPHPDYLRKIYRYDIQIKKQNLLNKNQIEYLLHELHTELTKDENEPIIATLAFDAATIDPTDQGSNALIVFDAQPLKGEYKSKVVYVQKNKNGKANKETISSIVNDINDAGQKTNIIFRFIASDGDSATNQLHREFNYYIKNFKGGLNEDFLDYIGKYEKPIPISDWLHLLKNLRTRINENNIILFKGSEVINIHKIGEFLDLEDAVMNARGRATMRDDLALRLINDINLLILGENEQYCSLILMLPFVIFTIVIQSQNLSVNARKQLCLLAYDIIVQISEESENLPQHRSRFSNNAAYLLNMMKIRTLNTIIGVAYALKDYGDSIMTSRLGTHIVEFIFGRMRNGCQGFDSLDKCMYQLVKSEVSKEILDKYNKEEVPILGRSHPGGSCFCEDWNIEIEENIDLKTITKECKELIHHKVSYSETNLKQLIEFLSNVTPIEIPNLRGSICGSKITARQINYKSQV